MIDDLVASITPYNGRPTILHGYVGPFLVFYLIWFYVWSSLLGFWDYVEIGCIVSAAIGIVQALTVLFCHWLVGFRCLLTCKKVIRA